MNGSAPSFPFAMVSSFCAVCHSHAAPRRREMKKDKEQNHVVKTCVCKLVMGPEFMLSFSHSLERKTSMQIKTIVLMVALATMIVRKILYGMSYAKNQRLRLWVVVSAIVMSFLSGYRCYATVVLAPADGRVWQTVFHPSQPLSWRWTDDAVRAEVTFSNLVSSVRMDTVFVTRSAGTPYGECPMPQPSCAPETGEGLVDAVLTQYDSSDEVVYEKTARLAFLPGADGGGFTVEKGSRKRFAVVKAARVIPYDNAWTNAAAATGAGVLFTPDSGVVAESALIGTGGYFVHSAGAGRIEVAFTDTDVALVADIFPYIGLYLSFR